MNAIFISRFINLPLNRRRARCLGARARRLGEPGKGRGGEGGRKGKGGFRRPPLTSRAIWLSASSSAVRRSRFGSRFRPAPCVPMADPLHRRSRPSRRRLCPSPAPAWRARPSPPPAKRMRRRPPPPPFWGDGPGAASGPSLTHPPRAGCGQGRAARPIPSHPFLRSSPLSRGQPRRRAGDPCPAAPALLAGHSPGLPGFRSLPATCPPEASCPQSWRKFPWNQGNGRHILTSCEPGRFLCHKDGGSGPETCLLPWILTHLVAPWDPLNHSFSC